MDEMSAKHKMQLKKYQENLKLHEQIAEQRRLGRSIAQITRMLGLNASTVKRLIARPQEPVLIDEEEIYL